MLAKFSGCTGLRSARYPPRRGNRRSHGRSALRTAPATGDAALETFLAEASAAHERGLPRYVVLPDVPIRQGVLSVPFELRLLLARNAVALSAVGRVFVQEVLRWQREQARATTRSTA